MKNTILPYLIVGIGGFAGACARFVVARFVASVVATPFPLGTFLINVVGSFLLGVLVTMAAHKLLPAPEALQLALGVGFLGAFTTFSTFELETHTLFETGAWGVGLINVIASVLVGFVAVRVGIALTKAWLI